MKKVSLLMVFLLVLTLMMGCQLQETSTNEETSASTYDYEVLAREVVITDDSVSFVDASGEEVSVKKNPKRVIGLYNSYSDLWYQCGGDLVGRIDSKTGLPEAFESAEIVGKITEPNIELILELEPDLVILRHSKQGDIINILKENGIDYVAMEYNSFEDYLKMMKIFSEVNGKPELYQTLGIEVKEEIENIVSRVPDEKKTALLIFATSKSYKAYLSNTTNGQILEQLGVENIGESFGEVEVGATSIEFSMEKLLEIDPDFILVQSMSTLEKVQKNLAENVESDAAWSSLSAVKNGNYIFLERSLFHYKPNEEYAKAYLELAKILYPEEF